MGGLARAEPSGAFYLQTDDFDGYVNEVSGTYITRGGLPTGTHYLRTWNWAGYVPS